MSGATPGASKNDFQDQRARSLARIYELTTDLLDVQDISAFLERVAESVRELFGFSLVGISIVDDARGVFTDHVLAGYSPEDQEAIRKMDDRFTKEEILQDFREDCRVSRITYYIPAEKQSSSVDGFVFVRDREAALEPRLDSSSWHELDLLYFALLDRKGQMIGYLQVDYPLDGKIPSRDTLEEIELFAGVAAVGIENSRMFNRVRSLLDENEVKAQRILKILELTRSVLRIDDLDVVLQKVSDAVSFVFGFRKTGVSMFSDESDRVTVHSLTGYRKDEAEALMRSTILKSVVMEDFKEEFRVTETGYFIPAESQKNGAEGFVFLENPERATMPRSSPDSWHELDLLYFGLHDRNGHLIGYIQLDYPQDDRIPTKETMEAMEAFASLASIAIENSALFEGMDDARKQVRTYLDILTHDVGNLVSPLNAYLEMMLTTTALTSTQTKYLGSALESSKSILHLIRNVRRMAQTAEITKPQLAPVNISKTIHQVVADAKNAFVGRHIEIHISLPEEDMWIMADSLVDEVLYNLITNSVKYDGHEDVIIDVEAKVSEFESRPSILVRIADRGVGIPDEFKEKVFVRGFRESHKSEWPTAPKAKGAGMGLPLVKSLVDRYGGKIWIENRVHADFTRGSVVNVILPCA
jgi:signal transduction histidine kinase/uncharacterized protein YigA (DUF484 family)